MMTIDIYDVGHGACAVITCPNGTRIMIDCGFGRDAGWYPSVAYAGSTIDLLTFMNLDEDHVDDLPRLLNSAHVKAVCTNPTVTPGALEIMKAKDGMKPGVSMVQSLLTHYGTKFIIGPYTHDAGGVFAWAHWNQFWVDFTDTNNLSLAMFVRYGAFTILFAGDLEEAGWRSLLLRPEFCAALRTVNVLVASHHGRRNGCCVEAFEYMRPGVVVFSDKSEQYETQKTDDWYRHRVSGINGYTAPKIGGGFEQRRILTTRRDGTMRFAVNPDGSYLVTPSKSTPRMSALAMLMVKQLVA